MYTQVNFTDFRNAFFAMGRETQFSAEALRIIFDYIEQYEEETEEHIELDVIAICCDFVEMTEEELRDSYTIQAEESDVLGWLEYNTSVCGSYKNESGEDVFVFQSF